MFDSENRDDSRSVPHVAPPARFGVRLNFSFSSLIYRSMEAFSLGMRLTPSHAINKGQRYRYYVSAALITEAGTDRAQSRRMVARVLGTRPEWLSKRRRRALSSRPLIRLRIAASSNADVLEPDGDRLAVRNYLHPYARVIARALAARVAEGFWVRFAPDSPVEEDGFEPSVPRLR